MRKEIIGLIIGLAIAIVVVIAGVAGVLFFLNQETSIEERLQMGNRYLEELDYDEAIETFQKIMDIDPKCVDAYIGLADAYIGKGDYESAVETLEKGIDETGDGELQNYLDEVKVEKENHAHKDKSDNTYANDSTPEDENAFEDVQDVLENIAGYCESGNYDELYEYMKSDDYQRILDIADELETAYRVETAHGNVGIYKIDTKGVGKCMIYYGDYKDDIREGEGDWFGYHEGYYYHARGSWAADAPNGYQERHTWGISSDGNTYNAGVKGNTVNGLWDGPAEDWYEDGDGTINAFPVTFENGKYVVLEYDEDDEEYPYVVSKIEKESGTSTFQKSDVDSLNGIIGFIH